MFERRNDEERTPAALAVRTDVAGLRDGGAQAFEMALVDSEAVDMNRSETC